MLRLVVQMWLPSCGGQANRVVEQRLKDGQTAVLPLASYLLLAAHAPGSAHGTHSIEAIAPRGAPKGSRGRQNAHAEVIEVTVRTQLCDCMVKRHRLCITRSTSSRTGRGINPRSGAQLDSTKGNWDI